MLISYQIKCKDLILSNIQKYMHLATIIIRYLIPEIIIAYMIMRIFSGYSWQTFIYIFLILQGFYFIRRGIHLVVGWIHFKIHKHHTISKIYLTLKENDFPNPEKYNFSTIFPEDYYGAILNDSDLKEEVRMIAQASDTEIKVLRSLGLFVLVFRLIHTHTEAIKSYQFHVKTKEYDTKNM